MTDNEWFAIVGEAVIFCARLVQKIKTVKAATSVCPGGIDKTQNFCQRLGRTIWLRHRVLRWTRFWKKLDPGNYSNYKEFIRALLIEALANTEFTFDELNYNLYALNKEIFNQLNKETTAFF